MADRPRTPVRKSKPLPTLVASARVMNSPTIQRTPVARNLDPWQEESWECFDGVGEYRFGTGWIGNGLSRVNLCAASTPERVGDEPVAINTDPDAEGDDVPTKVQARAAELVASIAGGPHGQGQMLQGFATQLTVAGFGWLVAEPDDTDQYASWEVYAQDALTPEGKLWKIQEGEGTNATRTLHEHALVVECWRGHPRYKWKPDSPVRAALPILRVIQLLTAHIAATSESRLAGSGVWAIPQEMELPTPPPKESADDPDPVDDDQARFDYFVDQLVQVMTVPIKDRSVAGAVVPHVIQVPGEMIQWLKDSLITFGTEFDDRIESLLNLAIKRLALALDMPPEVLTGMADVNHWTAWQVEETAITLHLEPLAELVCYALNEGYLRPALTGEGFSADEIRSVMVWYSTADLTQPPDRSAAAATVYEKGELSGEALRRESGFTEDDAPDDDERVNRVLLDIARTNAALAPELLVNLGYITPEQAQSAIDRANEARFPDPEGGAPTEDTEPPADDAGGEGPPPVEDRPSGDRASLAVAWCDGIVYRAMERAGARLRSAVGKKVDGGPQSITWSDTATLHTVYDAQIYADFDHLLDGAFGRVAEIAAYTGLDADALEAALRGYCRGLLASQQSHAPARLVAFLGDDEVVLAGAAA